MYNLYKQINQSSKQNLLLVVLMLCVAVFTNNTANAQKQQHYLSRNDSALVKEYLSKAEELFGIDDLKTSSDWLNKTAMLYWEHNHFAESAKIYEQSLEYNQTLGNENGIAMIQSNLGMIYFDQGKYKESIFNFQKTLAARRARGEKVSIISSLINLSVAHNKIEEYPASIIYMEEAKDIARELNDRNQMKSCFGMLSETYEKAGNQEKSIYYFELYRTFHEMVQKERVTKVKEKLRSERLQRELIEVQKQNQQLVLYRQKNELSQKDQQIHQADSTQKELSKSLSKQQMQLKLIEQEQHIATIKNQEHERKQRMRVMITIGILLFVIIVAALLYYALRRQRSLVGRLSAQNGVIQSQSIEIQQSLEELSVINDELASLNKDVASSINYAALIQSASMYQKVRLSEIVADSFIFFQPRDVVSGDFYWYQSIGDLLFVAAVDCTGHGVPGGFMSMIGNNLLKEIVTTQKIHEPAEILMQMDIGVQSALNQKLNDNKDGMDMSLCVINRKQKTLSYAGAKNPMMLFVDNEYIFTKGSRDTIGGSKRNIAKDFEQHTFELGKNNVLYIYSDGYQDQFGGERDRKYGSKKFRQLLTDNRDKPMAEQHSLLFETIENWKSSTKQLDDILVMGLHF